MFPLRAASSRAAFRGNVHLRPMRSAPGTLEVYRSAWRCASSSEPPVPASHHATRMKAQAARLKPSGHLPSPEDGPQTLTRPVTGLRKCSPRSCPPGRASFVEVSESPLDVRRPAPQDDAKLEHWLQEQSAYQTFHCPNPYKIVNNRSPPTQNRRNRRSCSVFQKNSPPDRRLNLLPPSSFGTPQIRML